MGQNIRKPAVAGAFYPSDKESLSLQVGSYLSVAETDSLSDCMAVIVPHAGYIYSGEIAATAYKAVANINYECAIIFGRSHRAWFNSISLDNSVYQTPLGNIEIDKEIHDFLKSQDGFDENSTVHEEEHSLEVQLPFLKTIYPNIKIVCALFGDEDESLINGAAKALQQTITKFSQKKILLVCSTDLSHYHSYQTAKIMDTMLAGAVKTLDEESLKEGIADGNMEACGYPSIATTIKTAKKLGKKEAVILSLKNSGDTSSDKSRVVGYLSAAI